MKGCILLIFKLKFYNYLASFSKGNFQRVCEKKVKMMVKEVLKGYSKNSCKGNGKANVP